MSLAMGGREASFSGLHMINALRYVKTITGKKGNPMRSETDIGGWCGAKSFNGKQTLDMYVWMYAFSQRLFAVSSATA